MLYNINVQTGNIRIQLSDLYFSARWTRATVGLTGLQETLSLLSIHLGTTVWKKRHPTTQTWTRDTLIPTTIMIKDATIPLAIKLPSIRSAIRSAQEHPAPPAGLSVHPPSIAMGRDKAWKLPPEMPPLSAASRTERHTRIAITAGTKPASQPASRVFPPRRSSACRPRGRLWTLSLTHSRTVCTMSRLRVGVAGCCPKGSRRRSWWAKCRPI